MPQIPDHGEVEKLDGGTLVLDGEESPSVVLRLAPWRARSMGGTAGADVRVADFPPHDSTAPGRVGIVTDAGAAALGDHDEPIM